MEHDDSTRMKRLLRASHRSATRHALPFCMVAAIAALFSGLSEAALCLAGLGVVGHALRPSRNVQI